MQCRACGSDMVEEHELLMSGESDAPVGRVLISCECPEECKQPPTASQLQAEADRILLGGSW